MGLLDAVLGPVLQTVGLGGGVGPAQATAGTGAGVAQAVLAPVATVTDVVTGAVGGVSEVAGAAVAAPTQILGAVTGAVVGAPVDLTGFSKGNGNTATRTTVETMDVNTGQIIRTKSMPGTPFLMNSDVNAARRVIKKSANLRKRLPKQKVTESDAKKLEKAAVQEAIRVVQAKAVKCD